MLTAGWRRPDGSRGPGARRSAGLPLRSPSISVASGGPAYGNIRHTETVIPRHHGFLVLPEEGVQDGEVTQAMDLCKTRLYKALAQRPQLL